MNAGPAAHVLAPAARTTPACPPRAGGLPGTLAAAGTIPDPPMNALAILVISAGRHPAKRRSAIPTRAYESGSGHGHDAAPAGHPHPRRSRPPPLHGRIGGRPGACPGQAAPTWPLTARRPADAGGHERAGSLFRHAAVRDQGLICADLTMRR